jgi:predicted dehydrogenase
MKHTCLMIGVGGMARHWRQQVWGVLKDRVEVCAIADVNPGILNSVGDELGIPVAMRFTDTATAIAQSGATFCAIVTPPQFHREAVEAACAHGIQILSEKPLAANWDDCLAIARAVRASGVKMMVTQNYRYMPRMLTLKKAVQSLGPVNYVIARYAEDYRRPLSWGAAFRHEMAHALLIEASIHHFDQIRNLSGANCATIAGHEWNPGHTRGAFAGSDSFKREASGLFVLKMTDGGFASYEGNNLATGKTNGWHSEYYRVECEGGAAVLDKDDVVRIEERGEGGTLKIREVPVETATWTGHTAIGAQFLDWLDGGPAPATVLEDNLQSNAIMHAALEAAETGQTIDVQRKLAVLDA